jgi:hypothetical protein
VGDGWAGKKKGKEAEELGANVGFDAQRQPEKDL